MSRYQLLLLFVLLCFYGAIAALWLLGAHTVYFELLRGWGVEPWHTPFLDMSGTLSWAECHRRGVDVFVTNPCDPLNRPLNYTPVLLALPLKAADSLIVGALQNVAFLFILPFVLRPRSASELAIAVIASLSTVTVYALERANLDVSIFVLLSASALLSTRGTAGRTTSYALILLAGVTKIHPFVLIPVVLRESPRLALTLGGVSLSLMLSFFCWYWSDFLTIAQLLPPFDMDASDVFHAYRSDDFGAFLLPTWVAAWSSIPNTAFLQFLGLILAFGAFSIWLAREIRPALIGVDWDDRSPYLLLSGSLVLAGCFFVQSNMSYRLIFAMFLIPGFLEMRRRMHARRLQLLFGVALWLTLGCMWREMFSRWLETSLSSLMPRIAIEVVNAVSVAFFAIRELIWWFLVSVMMAVVLAFVSKSSLAAAVGSVARRTAVAHNERSAGH